MGPIAPPQEPVSVEAGLPAAAQPVGLWVESGENRQKLSLCGRSRQCPPVPKAHAKNGIELEINF